MLVCKDFAQLCGGRGRGVRRRCSPVAVCGLLPAAASLAVDSGSRASVVSWLWSTGSVVAVCGLPSHIFKPSHTLA